MTAQDRINSMIRDGLIRAREARQKRRQELVDRLTRISQAQPRIDAVNAEIAQIDEELAEIARQLRE